MPVEDQIIVREVAGTKAYIAPYGQTQALYEKVAQRCNGYERMRSEVNWKQCQDRYQRLQDTFDKEDVRTHLRSGIGGGKLSELNELLSQMREARDDLKHRKTAKKERCRKMKKNRK